MPAAMNVLEMFRKVEVGLEAWTKFSPIFPAKAAAR
jgi:hypothetical protein